MSKGILYLIPVPIHNEEDFNIKLIPPYIIELINNLKFFAVENIRTSRRFIKKLNPNFDIDNTNFFIVDKRTGKEIIREIVDRLLDGNDVGVMSESGCPGILIVYGFLLPLLFSITMLYSNLASAPISFRMVFFSKST